MESVHTAIENNSQSVKNAKLAWQQAFGKKPPKVPMFIDYLFYATDRDTDVVGDELRINLAHEA